jgi:hypothetical protein
MSTGVAQEWAFLVFEALQKVAEVIVSSRLDLPASSSIPQPSAYASQPRKVRVSGELAGDPLE